MVCQNGAVLFGGAVHPSVEKGVAETAAVVAVVLANVGDDDGSFRNPFSRPHPGLRNWACLETLWRG
ncbi:unnamed protein product [Ectocarpus sp. CCAP 1310/34]|nr:unnamed protein product [Ectocarpus sp. CCAP 1310/34]